MKHLLPTLFITLLILGCGTENEPTFELTVSVVGEGTVTPSTGVFDKNEDVILAATPSNGWKFVRWEGDWSGTTNPVTVKMSKDYTIIGVFEKRDYPLTITIEGEGTVTERVVTAKTTEYPFQTVVELTPTPSEGWRFKEWGGDLSGSEVPKRITVDGSKAVTVKFERKDYPLTITVVGEGTVTETIIPQKTTQYPFQTVVQLTPVPSEGWEFVSWGGDLSGSDVPKQITVDRAKNVTVTFQRKNYPLTITIVGEGTVTERIIPQKTTDYPFQTVVQLTPVPSEGWKFTQWSGDVSGTTVPLSVTVSKETNVTVTFTRIAYRNQNGITIMCPNGKVGEIGVVDGVQYEVVDRNRLIQRRDEGKDLTKVCTSLVTNMSGMFNGKNFNQPIGNWDVSNVTNMSDMFRDTPFNQPIGNWDVGNVTDMSYMFIVSSFNQSIGDWDVSKVTNMAEMFDRSTFNQPIGNWDVSSVRNMNRMFQSTVFNQPIGEWNVSNVRDMWGMFNGSSFNHPIGNWDVGNVTDMLLMFGSTPFNQSIENWDVSKVTKMHRMFEFSSFNKPIGDWNVSNVSDMSQMFHGSSFNQHIGNWNVSNVRSMEQMFRNSSFNQPIGDWNVSNVRNMAGLFDNTPFNQPLAKWNVSSVTVMYWMFQNSQFNHPIGNWDVGSVVNMWGMFNGSKFNQLIENWNVSSVVEMSSMFSNTPFNQPINKWCVSQIPSEPTQFSTSSPLTPQNKPVWGTCPVN